MNCGVRFTASVLGETPVTSGGIESSGVVSRWREDLCLVGILVKLDSGGAEATRRVRTGDEFLSPLGPKLSPGGT